MINIFQSKTVSTWGKADVHLHTTYSDGLMTPAETIDIIAANTSLNVIAITDHDTAEGAFVAHDHARRRHLNLDVIIGQEVTTGEGDVLGLYLQTSLPRFKTAAAAIAAIHRQGGLAVAAHPFAFGWGTESVYFAFLRLPFDAVEARHGCPVNIPGNVLTTVLNHLGPRLSALGNSDSHAPYTAGQALTWFPGHTAADLRQAIINHTVRPGGVTWTLTGLIRTLRAIAQRGMPSYPPKPELTYYETYPVG